MDYQEFRNLVEGCKHAGVKSAFLETYQSHKGKDPIDLRAVKAVFARRWEEINEKRDSLESLECYTIKESPKNEAYTKVAEGLATGKNFCPSFSSDASLEDRTYNLYLAEQSAGELGTKVAAKKFKYPVGTYSWLMPTIKKGDKTNALEYFEFYSLQECFVDPDGRLTLFKDILEGLKKTGNLVTRNDTFYGPKDIERLLKQFPSKKSTILLKIQDAYKPFEHITENTIKLLEELEDLLKELTQYAVCMENIGSNDDPNKPPQSVTENRWRDFVAVWHKDPTAGIERMQKLQYSDFNALLERFNRLQSSPSEYAQVARLKGSSDLTLAVFLTQFKKGKFKGCMGSYWREVQHHVRKIRHLRELNKFRSTIEINNDGPCLFAPYSGGKRKSTLRKSSRPMGRAQGDPNKQQEAEKKIEKTKCCPCFW